MANCPTCGYDSDDSNVVAALLTANVDSYEIRWADKGQAFHVAGVGRIEVVQDVPPMEYDSYGSGQDGDVFVVVKTHDGRLFRRDGYRDSYSDVEWRGAFRQVEAKPRVVTEYTYE